MTTDERIAALQARVDELEELLAPYIRAARSMRDQRERIRARQQRDGEIAYRAGAE